MEACVRIYKHIDFQLRKFSSYWIYSCLLLIYFFYIFRKKQDSSTKAPTEKNEAASLLTKWSKRLPLSALDIKQLVTIKRSGSTTTCTSSTSKEFINSNTNSVLLQLITTRVLIFCSWARRDLSSCQMLQPLAPDEMSYPQTIITSLLPTDALSLDPGNLYDFLPTSSIILFNHLFPANRLSQSSMCLDRE